MPLYLLQPKPDCYKPLGSIDLVSNLYVPDKPQKIHFKLTREEDPCSCHATTASFTFPDVLPVSFLLFLRQNLSHAKLNSPKTQTVIA